MTTTELPACRWRDGPRGDGRFDCRSPKILAPLGVPGELCAGCSLCDHAPPPGATSPAARFRPRPCAFLRQATGATRPCTTCTGTVQVPVHVCALHGLCTTDKLLSGVPCCRICPDHEERIP